jgi:predicted transposase YdaD
VAKFVTTEYAEPFIELILKYPNVTVLENLATEQITLKARETDSTLKVQFPDEVAILHNEVQTYDSQEPMPLRIAGYNGFLIREHKLNVYSSVLYLHPRAGRNDPGYYEYVGYGCEYRLKYRVIRLIEIEGQSILESRVPGLLPLLPLMKPPEQMNPTRWLETCVDATFNARVNNNDRNLLLAALGIFGGLVYEPQMIKQLLPEGIMQESPFFREYIREAEERAMERGLERGQKKCAIELILDLLSDQFQSDAVQMLKPDLERIDDLDRLKALLRAVPKAPSLEAFTETLRQ